MTFDAHRLFELLPAILKIQDQSRAVVTPGLLVPFTRARFFELRTKKAATSLTDLESEELERLTDAAKAGPLASLLGVLAESIATLEEDLEQLYDDLFIETCAKWVAPYIGDLIGYRTIHGVTARVASRRAEVAHTIAHRRGKGRVTVLEQLARDVTGWNATAVEYFERLAMTQYMNHRRPKCLASPDLRRWEPLDRLGGPFDTIMRTVDVRRIGSGRGRHNIPNVGVFLWRVDAWPLSSSAAVAVDARRWHLHPLGLDQPLYALPRTLDELAALSSPLNVPQPIGRRTLAERLGDYYSASSDATRSLRLLVSSSGSFQPIPPERIRVCALDDDGATWAHLPSDDVFAVDPELGRVAGPANLPANTELRADFHYGFGAPLGGGEYDRGVEAGQTSQHLARVPDEFPTITAALAAIGSDGGVVEITDSGRYEETLGVTVPAGKRVELRAADRCRPTLVLGGDFEIAGGEGSELRLDGLLVSGATIRVTAPGAQGLAGLRIRHCTLVPGLTLEADATPTQPDAANLAVERDGVAVSIERSIVGALRIDPESTVEARDSILDATATDRVAYSGPDTLETGGALSLSECTVIGKIHARTLPLVSNSILLASLSDADAWSAPVIADRRQEGCVRFTWLPAGARVPRRYQCLPESAASPSLAVPRFGSLRYGFPTYGQLSDAAGERLRTGADDEGQPGAFHFLFEPQRETNLRVRIDEYLRVGLEAGVFHAS